MAESSPHSGGGHGHTRRTPDVSHVTNPDVSHETSDVRVGPTSLKAMLPCTVWSAVRMMLPMVSSVEEVRAVTLRIRCTAPGAAADIVNQIEHFREQTQ